MRRWLKNRLPKPEQLAKNRWLRFLGKLFQQPQLWQITRQSIAKGVSIGLFCGLIPGPLQMLSAAIVAVLIRANLPLSLVMTIYSNPFTIVPLYLLAYQYGTFVLQEPIGTLPKLVETSSLREAIPVFIDWGLQLGKPLLVGLILLAITLSAVGYFLVDWSWRLFTLWQWRQRRQNRRHRNTL